MKSLDELQTVRAEAALAANADDAAVWRWLSSLVEDRRIRWCLATDVWLVSVDNRHVATERSYDEAIRSAKRFVDEGDGVKALLKRARRRPP
jgi:hypothetical protein